MTCVACKTFREGWWYYSAGCGHDFHIVCLRNHTHSNCPECNYMFIGVPDGLYETLPGEMTCEE